IPCKLLVVLLKQLAILTRKLFLQRLQQLFTITRRHLAPCLAGPNTAAAQFADISCSLRQRRLLSAAARSASARRSATAPGATLAAALPLLLLLFGLLDQAVQQSDCFILLVNE